MDNGIGAALSRKHAMRTGILFALLFFTLLLIEVSFFHAFSGNLANIPVMIIAGMIIMQRVGIEEGIAWFITLAVMRGDGIALLLAGIGPVLILQIFTTRSVYALLGFGAVAYILASIIFLLVGGLVDQFLGTSILLQHPIIHALQELALLIPGLFLGVLLVRSIERRILNQFAFKSST